MKKSVTFLLASVVHAGAELQATKQIKALSDRGYKVSLVVLSSLVEEELIEQSGLHAHQIFRSSEKPYKIEGAFIRASIRQVRQVATFMRSRNTTHIVAVLPPAHFFSRILWLVYGGSRPKIFQYFHALDFLNTPSNTFGKKIFRFFNKRLGRMADYAHWYVSKAVSEHLRSFWNPRRSNILENTVDTYMAADISSAKKLLKEQNIPLNQSKWNVLIAGRLHRTKGHDIVIKAVAELISKGAFPKHGLNLIFAGGGPEQDTLIRLAQEREIEDSITLLGRVNQNTLLGLFRLADLVVIPSRSEGFGNVAIEALSQGAVVLASDAGGLASIIRNGENGFVFPSENMEALKSAFLERWNARKTPAGLDFQKIQSDVEARYGLSAHTDCLEELLDA